MKPWLVSLLALMLGLFVFWYGGLNWFERGVSQGAALTFVLIVAGYSYSVAEYFEGNI